MFPIFQSYDSTIKTIKVTSPAHIMQTNKNLTNLGSFISLKIEQWKIGTCNKCYGEYQKKYSIFREGRIGLR